MESVAGFNMKDEFANLDFNSGRLEKRFVRTMETLAEQPDKSIFAYQVDTGATSSR